MRLDLNVTRTWKSFHYTENSGYKDIWLMHLVLPNPRAGKKPWNIKTWDCLVSLTRPQSWSWVQVGGLLTQGRWLSRLFTADPAEKQRCTELWAETGGCGSWASLRFSQRWDLGLVALGSARADCRFCQVKLSYGLPPAGPAPLQHPGLTYYHTRILRASLF